MNQIDRAMVNRAREHKDYPRAKEIEQEMTRLTAKIAATQKRIDDLQDEQYKLDPHAVGVVDFDLHDRPKQ